MHCAKPPPHVKTLLSPFHPPTIFYEMIKNALHSERLEEIIKVGRYFLRFDAQVSKVRQ
ncbi:hypothetical protein [Helicobacter vulpis]|uniref:hypothetical protein n=1 Tax=Helicobacter vulpis TaxID=2316076 RepID=UPI0013CE0EE1|nr:hypothetical protein [Helicobacter vulpis]